MIDDEIDALIRPRIYLLVTALALAAVGAGVGLMQSVNAPPTAAPPVSRQQVLDAAKAQKGVALRIDRIESKLVTWHDVQVARHQTSDFVASLTPNQQLWVVAMAGDFAPQLASGEHYTWAVSVYDASSGLQVATYAGPGAWPAFFIDLVDQAPR